MASWVVVVVVVMVLDGVWSNVHSYQVIPADVPTAICNILLVEPSSPCSLDDNDDDDDDDNHTASIAVIERNLSSSISCLVAVVVDTAFGAVIVCSDHS